MTILHCEKTTFIKQHLGYVFNRYMFSNINNILEINLNILKSKLSRREFRMCIISLMTFLQNCLQITADGNDNYWHLHVIITLHKHADLHN